MNTEQSDNHQPPAYGYTMAEVVEAIAQLPPAMDRAWQLALDNDALWSERAKRRGWFGTWWLRWQLRKGREVKIGGVL